MDTKQRLRFFYGVFLGVFTAAVGIALIVLASQIYFADPNGTPYSRELVGAQLQKMIAPAVLWVLAVIAGFVLSVLFPSPKAKVSRDDGAAVRRLRRRIPMGETEEFLRANKNYRKFELARRIVWTVCFLFAVAAGVISVVYLSDASHFPATNLNREVIAMLRHILPWIGAAFVLVLGATLFEMTTAKKELAMLKQLLVLGKGSPVRQSKLNVGMGSVLGAAERPLTLWIVRGVLFALAVSFIIAGVVNGGMGDVLGKAIKICTECIGLG